MAFLRDEPGAERVEELLGSAESESRGAAFISTVNLSELHQKFGESLPDMIVGNANSVIVGADFTALHAKKAAELHGQTKKAGLSLADRACLSLAMAMDRPVITADRAWTKIDVGVEVELIR